MKRKITNAKRMGKKTSITMIRELQETHFQFIFESKYRGIVKKQQGKYIYKQCFNRRELREINPIRR